MTYERSFPPRLAATFALVSLLATGLGASSARAAAAPPVFVADHFYGPTFSSAADRFIAEGALGSEILDLNGTSLDSVGAPGEYPEWSPDGTTLLTKFTSRMLNSVDSWEVSTGYSGPIWNVLTSRGRMTWDPSGTSFVYADALGLQRIPYPSGSAAAIPCTLPGGGDCGNTGACFSPDGASIVFSQGTGLWRVGANGGQAVRLLDGSLRTGWQGLSHPAWSSDGDWIAVAVNGSAGAAVWIVSAQGEDAGNGPLTEWLPKTVTGIDWRPGTHEVFFGLDFQIWKSTSDSSIPAVTTSWGGIKSIYR